VVGNLGRIEGVPAMEEEGALEGWKVLILGVRGDERQEEGCLRRNDGGDGLLFLCTQW
jgi:hypothetical protein